MWNNQVPPWYWYNPMPPQTPINFQHQHRSKNEFKEMIKSWEAWEEFQEKRKKKEEYRKEHPKKASMADWFLGLVLIGLVCQAGSFWIALQMLKALK